MTIFRKKEKLEYTEKEILCDLIENYITVANQNDTTLDDYISIISLIKVLQNEYKEYNKYFQKYIEIFREKGILDEYRTYQKSKPKQIFIENNFKENTKLAEKMLYGWFDGCTSRPMHLMIIFGLCGNPTTKKQKYIMAQLFEANWSIFNKQKQYYTKLYLNVGVNADGIWNSHKEKEDYINAQYYAKYKTLATSSNNKDDYEKYMLKAKEYKNVGNSDLARFYISNKQFDKAKDEIDLIILNKTKIAKEDGYVYELDKDTYTKQLVIYYKYKSKYPYLRKELLEMFNLDIKTFNKMTKDIKDNLDFKNNSGYSDKIIEFLKNKIKN